GWRRRPAQHGRVPAPQGLRRPSRHGLEPRPAPRPHHGACGRALRSQHRQPGQPAAQEDRGRPARTASDQDPLGRWLFVLDRGQGRMRRWWRASLSGRLISLTLLSLVAAHLLAVAISLNERGRALGEASRAEFYSRATNMALLLESMPPELRQKIVGASAAV